MLHIKYIFKITYQINIYPKPGQILRGLFLSKLVPEMVFVLFHYLYHQMLLKFPFLPIAKLGRSLSATITPNVYKLGYLYS